MYTYLIETPGIYTKEREGFRSREAYQFVTSGHVKPLWFQCHSVGDNILYCFIKGKVNGSSLVLPKEGEECIKIVLHDIRFN